MSSNQFHSCASYCDSSGTQDNNEVENKHSDLVRENQEGLRNKELSGISVSEHTNVNDRSKSTRQSISVVGMGKSGLSLISRLVTQKFGVIAVDNMPLIVNAILSNDVKSLPEEYRDQIFSSRSNKTLSATTNLSNASKCSDVIIITPSWSHTSLKTSNGIENLLELANSIGHAIASTTKYQLVAFYDFDNFEFLRETLTRTMQVASGKEIGKNLGVCGIIENLSKHHNYATAYIKGFDPSSELAIRRVYKKLGAVNTVFDY